MAIIKLDWDSVEFQASKVSGWVSFKNAVELDKHENLLSSRAVYVIRTMRPYSFSCGDKYSPVAYIGKEQAQNRLTSHLKSWIPELSKRISDLKVKIYFCEPRIRKLGAICEHVEADLIQHFLKFYGELPLRNRNSPGVRGKHIYDPKELHVLHSGKGTGYHWAIRPLASSGFFRNE